MIEEVFIMLSELTECTIVMLKVIHKLYIAQRITYEEFVSHTAKKLQFLAENLHYFTNEAERRNICDIIHECSSVMPDGRYC